MISSVQLCGINVKFTLILKEHTKFVSETYLSNLSLDEDQMPHDLQPRLEKRHNLRDCFQPGWKDFFTRYS